MNKNFYILVIVMAIILLLGCSNNRSENNNIVDGSMEESIISIEIINNVRKKTFTSKDDLSEIFEIINNINIIEQDFVSFEDKDILKVNLYNKNNEKIKSISLVYNMVFIDNIWSYDSYDAYSKMIKLYEESNSIEIEVDDLVNINFIKKQRQEKTLKDALKGTWVDQNNSIIKFDGEFLYQGENNEHKFKYVINKDSSKTATLVFYGTEGFFIDDKELFEYEIVLDNSNSYIKLNKSIGNQVYQYKLIYVDNGLLLGSLNSSFFIN
ncbi:MAG: hypothetical protein SCJ93_10585 [Bacillota bacterium]|nr:hypothetical protein [Bacillota bacterium]